MQRLRTIAAFILLTTLALASACSSNDKEADVPSNRFDGGGGGGPLCLYCVELAALVVEGKVPASLSAFGDPCGANAPPRDAGGFTLTACRSEKDLLAYEVLAKCISDSCSDQCTTRTAPQCGPDGGSDTSVDAGRPSTCKPCVDVKCSHEYASCPN